MDVGNSADDSDVRKIRDPDWGSASGTASCNLTTRSRSGPSNRRSGPKFCMAIPSVKPLSAVLYWKPKSNATPLATSRLIPSWIYLIVVPNDTRSVNNCEYVNVTHENLGESISPVPSGASSVVTIISPTANTRALIPTEISSRRRVVIAK